MPVLSDCLLIIAQACIRPFMSSLETGAWWAAQYQGHHFTMSMKACLLHWYRLSFPSSSRHELSVIMYTASTAMQFMNGIFHQTVKNSTGDGRGWGSLSYCTRKLHSLKETQDAILGITDRLLMLTISVFILSDLLLIVITKWIQAGVIRHLLAEARWSRQANKHTCILNTHKRREVCTKINRTCMLQTQDNIKRCKEKLSRNRKVTTVFQSYCHIKSWQW